MFAYQSYVALLEQKILWWIVKVRVLDGVFCSERKDLIWALLFLLCCEVMLLHRMAQHAFYDWFDTSISLLHCSLPVSKGLMQQKSFLWEGQNWNIFVCLLHLIINNYQQLKADHAKYFYVCPCYPFLRGYWNFCQMFKNASVIYRILRELAWTLQERLSFPLYAVEAHGSFGYEYVFLLTSLFRICNSGSQENKGLLLPTFLNLPLSTTFFSQFEWCGHASVIGWLKW